MFAGRWRLFHLFGIPVYVDASWLIILALLTMSLADFFPYLLRDYYPELPALTTASYWLMALLAALAFFGCIVLHEMGHAVAARSRQMPIRGITLFMFGGVAEIGDEPPSAGAELVMAIAGPAVSVVLALLFGAAAWLGYQHGWPAPLVVVLAHLGLVNAIVLIFNLIPAFPLDGGRVLRAILWRAWGSLRRATYWAALTGRAFAWLLIGWGLVNFFAGNWFGGLWFGLIGLFLSNAAQMAYQQVILRQALEGEPVHRFMNRDPIAVPPDVDLRHWVEDYVYRYHRKTFPVAANGHVEGWIDTQALADIPREEWEHHAVRDVMRRDLEEATIAPHADALQALSKMQRSGKSRLLVTEGDRLVGIISLKDLLRFFNLKIELEGIDDEAKRGESTEESTEKEEHAPLRL
jgi:Zn-dependent protease/CBS domain-containing protein